jgi:hypothetical protein
MDSVQTLKVSHVELQITSLTDKFEIIDAVELLRDEWVMALCRDSSREFLAPYVVVTEQDALEAKNEGEEEALNADACSVNKDCGSCTAHADNRDLAKKCSWCPKSKTCHDYLSSTGTCSRFETYTEAKYCECMPGFIGRNTFVRCLFL